MVFLVSRGLVPGFGQTASPQRLTPLEAAVAKGQAREEEALAHEKGNTGGKGGSRR